jgi:hypothetical protein
MQRSLAWNRTNCRTGSLGAISVYVYPQAALSGIGGGERGEDKKEMDGVEFQERIYGRTVDNPHQVPDGEGFRGAAENEPKMTRQATGTAPVPLLATVT